MNRSNSIETFIREHRQAFDPATPGAHGWQCLEKALDRLTTADNLERELMYNRILMDTQVPDEKVWAGIAAHLDNHYREPGESLERFIRNNRDAFDTEIPDLKTWGGVIKHLPGPKSVAMPTTWRHMLVRVAASLALVLAGVTGGIWYAHSGEPEAMAMGEVSNEYAELERYYQRDISGKQRKLASFTGSQPTEVHEDIQQLDDVMDELRQELAKVPPGNREQVIRAMIENYKARAAILQRVLERLEPTKTENSNSNNGIKNI